MEQAKQWHLGYIQVICRKVCSNRNRTAIPGLLDGWPAVVHNPAESSRRVATKLHVAFLFQEPESLESHIWNGSVWKGRGVSFRQVAICHPGANWKLQCKVKFIDSTANDTAINLPMSPSCCLFCQRTHKIPSWGERDNKAVSVKRAGSTVSLCPRPVPKRP